MVVNCPERRETLEKKIPEISKYNNEFFVFDFESTSEDGGEFVNGNGYSIFQVIENKLINLADSENDLVLGTHMSLFQDCISYLKNKKAKHVYTLKSTKKSEFRDEFDGDYVDPVDEKGECVYSYYNSSYFELCDGYKEDLEHAGIEVIVLDALP